MKRMIFRILLALAMFLPLAAVTTRAEDAGAIKARMAGRIASIDALKSRKVVGENNRGFLEIRGSASGADQQIVTDENADRTKVYEIIARQTGATPDAVGRARAQKIAQDSAKGVLLQREDGTWYEK